MPICPICKSAAEAGRQRSGDSERFDCPRCGRFEITGTALAMLPARCENDEARSRARLSHAIRSLGESKDWPTIDSTNLDGLVKQPLPGFPRQTRNLLQWAAKQLGDDHLGTVELPKSDSLAGIIGTIDGDRAEEFLALVTREGLIEDIPEDCIKVTSLGWSKLDERQPQTVRPPSPAPAGNFERDAEKVVTARCHKCGGDRKVFVRATHTVNGSDGEVAWSDTYDVLECRGCSTIFVRHEHWFSEHDWIDEDAYGNPQRNLGISTTYWPPPARRAKPEWVDNISDSMLRGLIEELYTALDAGLLVLSAIGARTVFDHASFLQVGDLPGGFAGKLKAMLAAGYISLGETRILEAMTDLGSASAHRGFSPNFEQLTSLVDILENYLERAFVLSAAADALRQVTPSRQQKGVRNS